MVGLKLFPLTKLNSNLQYTAENTHILNSDHNPKRKQQSNNPNPKSKTKKLQNRYAIENVFLVIFLSEMFARMYTPQIVVQGVRAARAQRAMDELSRGGEEEDGDGGTPGRRRGNDDETNDGDFVIKRD